MTEISCPNCGHVFAIEDVLAENLEERLKKKYEQQLNENLNRLKQDRRQVEEEREKLRALKAEQSQAVRREVELRLEEERKRLARETREDFEQKMKLLEEENNRHRQESARMKKREAELLRLQNQVQLKEQEMALELEKKLAERGRELEKKVEERARAGFEREREEMERRLREAQKNAERQAGENKRLKERELELLRLEQSLGEREEELRLKMEKEMLEKQAAIEKKAREKERENFVLEKATLEKKLEDAVRSAEELKRRAEQGSMQLQGEIQELAIEQALRESYPLDRVDEVPKGIRGADCLHTVFNDLRQACGVIVYESKNTKKFSNAWIAKLKKDQLNCKADIAVLVTEVMPDDMSEFGLRDGVWICGFRQLKSLSLVLRQMLIRMRSIKSSEENKGEKMALLYKYLTSEEFALHIRNLVETYDEMHRQLAAEKRAMERLWKKREQQINGVQGTVASLFGSIEGIAGKAIKSVDLLQLPG